MEQLNHISEELESISTMQLCAGDRIPDRKEVVTIIKELQSALFPFYFRYHTAALQDKIDIIQKRLLMQIELAFALDEKDEPNANVICMEFLKRLPAVKRMLLKDIDALYEGDPAAKSRAEVLLCYPGFYAISIYRLAHEMYLLNVPYLPRMMTEFAHEKTGIDIHAGAAIGEYFFIDHGTGIVIGETTRIGDHVKLYQGVTLGAKSFELDEDGNPVKGIKRHPDIGNNVIIYANATILGGNTVIGDGCTIGGSVWLTSSVPSGQKIFYNRA